MSRLLSPVALPCGVTLPNAISLAPLTNLQSEPDGSLGEDELRWLERRAKGGFGLISTCAAFVSAQGKAWQGQLGVATDEHLPGLTRLASALRPHGMPAIVQLHHGGVQAKLAEDPISTGGPEGARAATEEDIAQVITDYMFAAARAEQAGFSGVEIHGANGYLFTQFLSPADNPRTDAYGGSLENRARLLRQTLQAVRTSVSPGFVVGVRLSPVDAWARRGLCLADSVKVGEWLASDGADFIHLSLRDAGGSPPFEETDQPVVAAFREALPPEVKIVSAGGVWTPEEANSVLDAGADVVALGRAAIGNPDWPQRCAQEGQAPLRTPFSPAHLRSVAIGEAFLNYISQMPGMVEGGRPART